MSNRPYPEGLAWDEAWRQRRRADRLEAEVNRLCASLDEIQEGDLESQYACALVAESALRDMEWGRGRSNIQVMGS